MKGNAELQAALEGLPFIFLEKLVVKKLKAAGTKNYKDAAAALVAHVRGGKKGKFIWDDGQKRNRKNLVINILDDELTEIDRLTREFIANKFPQILERTTDECASRVVDELRAKWSEQSAWQDAVATQFRHNLEARWGKGLDLLRMLLTIFREQGDKNVKRLRRRKSVPATQEVMFRLHARSCQVADEIITLLENGFADGAMARWRTLHELSVTALLLAKHDDEDLAQRYIAHQFVEAKKATEDYEKFMVPLGHKPISKVEKSRIVKGYNNALQKYGRPFKTQYGWAAGHLKHAHPTFRDMEQAVKSADLRPYYQLASYNVHASAKGTFFRLGALGDVAIAGRSNVGLTDPAQNTARTLCLMDSLLKKTKGSSAAEIISMKAILLIRDEIAPAFWRAEKRLARDDRAVRRIAQAGRANKKEKPKVKTNSRRNQLNI